MGSQPPIEHPTPTFIGNPHIKISQPTPTFHRDKILKATILTLKVISPQISTKSRICSHISDENHLKQLLTKTKLLNYFFIPANICQISIRCFKTTNPHVKNLTPTSIGNPNIIFDIFPIPPFETLKKIIQPSPTGRGREQILCIAPCYHVKHQKKIEKKASEKMSQDNKIYLFNTIALSLFLLY